MAMPATDSTKTKYVYLEMILKDEKKSEVIAGLFRGIKNYHDKKLVIMHGIEDSIHVVNLEAYDFMTIEELDDEHKNMTFLTYEKADQDVALSMVETIHARLIAEGWAVENDKELIDIDKYSDVPEAYLKCAEIKKPASKDFVTGAFAGGSRNYSSIPKTPSTYTAPSYVKKVIEPTLFKRKDAKPTKSTLEKMLEAVNAVAGGTYKPVLPVEEIVDEPTSTEKPKFDDETSCGYGYGGYGY